MPHDILPAENRVIVSANWIQSLLVDSANLRPASRVSSGSHHSIPVSTNTLDSDVIEVSLVENLLGGEGDLAVEIKPKCGFLPSLRLLSDESRIVKSRRCRLCMHRLLRATDRRRSPSGSARNPTEPVLCKVGTEESGACNNQRHHSGRLSWDYCPLDLYSSDRQRRIHAVEELYASWQATSGEGNNMRLFVSGKAMRPTGTIFDTILDKNSIDSVEPTITENSDDTACDKMTETIGMELPDDMRDQLCAAIVDALDDAHVLPLLKALQQEFDPIGIEGLGQRAREEDHYSKGGTMPAEPDQAINNVFPESLLADPSPTELEAAKQFWLASVARASTLPVEPDTFKTKDLRTLLVFHGISAIFKDCSIIIRFPGALRGHQSSSLDPSWAIDLVNGPKAILKVIDLDLKPMRKANKWYGLDDRIWRNALQEEQRRDCEMLQRRCAP
ncbi:hypothetical protein QFC21_002634 [Naganishia friedmannii]|uniref:Uncharacterized protein n=1 Tax=Naganishia friedmannii TaxID=89922 RepID=A0ACC2VX71_9TREE|nr:hypothetical protein QFC21_002634 [Naganishia friedmannii]